MTAVYGVVLPTEKAAGKTVEVNVAQQRISSITSVIEVEPRSECRRLLAVSVPGLHRPEAPVGFDDGVELIRLI